MLSRPSIGASNDNSLCRILTHSFVSDKLPITSLSTSIMVLTWNSLQKIKIIPVVLVLIAFYWP